MRDDQKNIINELRREIEALRSEFYLNNFATSQDFSKYSRFNSRIKLPTYASAPSTCEIGEVYVNSGSGKIYVCSATNTWSLIGTQA